MDTVPAGSGPARRLLMMRHAKAASPGGVADHDRPLASRGRQDAPAVGSWLVAEGLVPDLVLASDSARTRETTTLVLQGAGGAAEHVPVVHTAALYEAGPHQVLHLVAGTPDAVTTLLVVGHEPTTSEVVRAVTGRPVSMPTAAVAVVELDGAWAQVGGGTGTLAGVRTPRQG